MTTPLQANAACRHVPIVPPAPTSTPSSFYMPSAYTNIDPGDMATSSLVFQLSPPHRGGLFAYFSLTT